MTPEWQRARNAAQSQRATTRMLRMRINEHLYDESDVQPEGIAIYSLSDPRDIRSYRYIGQTSEPRRRLLQHVNTARLWFPEEKPWWVKSPTLRPLYDWIRDLYRDEARLPVMVVSSWVPTPFAARVAERERIYDCLQRGLSILNVEGEVLGRRRLLL